MNYMPKIDRRAFVVSATAAAGGLALGFDLPFGGPQGIRAADGSPEINAWVVIRPDDTVVIRVARSEMGQGTVTGLAQLVAEELECDWSKVTTEYPTPGQNVARKRVWGDMSTGGSRGIRMSHEYVRQGGAAAREMLKQSSANCWKEPESGLAVVRDTWWQAQTALDALPVVWDEGENAKVSSASIAEWLKAGLDAPEAFVGNANGDAKAALASAAKKVEAVYAYPYQNHACMEPMNATALYTPDKCEVWGPTQNGEAAFAATLSASGLPADKCEVHKIHLGGGVGRRGAFHDYTPQAVLIAQQMPGTPVKLLW